MVLAEILRATGENQRGFAPLGIGLAQAATLRRPFGDRGIFRIFRQRKDFLASGGKLLVLPEPRLEGRYPQIVEDRPARRPMSEGLSSTSFCRIATALRYSASASAGLPVFISRSPR